MNYLLRPQDQKVHEIYQLEIRSIKKILMYCNISVKHGVKKSI